jgi:Chain length determinant protein
MENRPIVYDPDHDPTAGREAMPVRSVPRRQYAELPYPEAFEETGPSLLLEYLQILRRRKGTLFLAVFAGLLAALLFTFAQKPVYQARGSIEIQNLNENFLNMRAVNPTAADDGRSKRAETSSPPFAKPWVYATGASLQPVRTSSPALPKI